MSEQHQRGRSTVRIFRARYEERLAVIGAALVLSAATLLPLATVLADARVDNTDGHALLRAIGEIVASGALLARSVLLAAAVTAAALGVGVPLAVLLAKTDIVSRRASLLLHAFPMFLPPFLLALGWFYLLGRGSILSSEVASRLLFSPIGALAVMALAFTPVATSLTMLGLSAVDPSLEEAGRLVASPWRVITRILLPAAWPAIALACIVVFTLAFSELGVPMFLRVRVYPAAVFSRLGGASFSPGEAALLVLPLLVVAIALLALERTFVGRRSFAVLGLRREEMPRIALGAFRPIATLALWGMVALSLMPILGLLLKAADGGFALASRWIGSALENSLLTAALGAVAITTLGLFLGHAVARDRSPGRLVDLIAVLAFVTPAPLLGVGLIAVWNRPETRLVYSTLAIVIVGYVARYSIIGIRTVASAIVQTPPAFEEAAAVMGASYLKRLFRIVVPISARGLGVAALLAFVFCLRDLETAVLYYPPGGEPLPVRILTLEANGQEPVIAALAVVHVLVTAAAVAVGGALLGARRW